jgi:hypothetical protein
MKTVIRDMRDKMRVAGFSLCNSWRVAVPSRCVFVLAAVYAALTPLFSSSLSAEGAVSDELTYSEAIVRFSPMDAWGVDARISDILAGYYQKAFGGVASWDKIESFRFDGVLRLPEGSLRFYAFLKKPDYCKMVLVAPDASAPVVMAYDGSDAWQILPSVSPEPVTMPPLEAASFIRDAVLGGHLLYPTLLGKTIELVDARRLGGNLCHELKVTLPNGSTIRYLIDAITFEERQQIVVNPVTGARETTTHSELQKIAGVSIPFVSTMTVDGEFVYEIQMSAARVNLGVMPWMFSRPSGAYMPGLLPEGVAETDAPLEADLTGGDSLGAEAPVTGSFGLNEPAAGAFEATRFPDLDAATMQSISDDIGDRLL